MAACAVAALAMGSADADALSFDLPSDAADGFVNTAPNSRATDESVRVGNGGSAPNRVFINAIYFFELPDIGANRAISEANLSFLHIDKVSVQGSSTPFMNVWGLGFVSTPTLDPDWTVNGRPDPDPGLGIATRRLIEVAIVSTLTPDPAGSPITLSTDDQGDVALASFIEEIYAAGAGAGDFAVLRLAPEQPPDPNSGGTIGNVVGFSEFDSGSSPPILSFTAVPEPSSALLVALGLAGLARRRASG